MNQDNATGDVIDQTNTTDDVIVNADGSTAAPSEQNGSTEADEKGVSWQNRFYEINRKYENLAKSIPQLIQEAAQTTAQTVKQQASAPQEYSIEQYLQAKAQDPANAAYYDSKILQLQKLETAKLIEESLNKQTRASQEALQRQQAEAWAFQNFPQLRDPNSPFAQSVMQVFNSRPESKREPHDFALAAELVANRMGIKPLTAVNPQAAQLQQKERELKKLNKERAIEGDGRGRVNLQGADKRIQEREEALKSGNTRQYIEKYLVPRFMPKTDE